MAFAQRGNAPNNRKASSVQGMFVSTGLVTSFRVNSAWKLGEVCHIVGTVSDGGKIWKGDTLQDSQNATLTFKVVSVALGGANFISDEVAVTLVVHELPCAASELIGKTFVVNE